ncbi:hypothetical protein [uncultured Sphingomonas sp.]|uniref:hypothetical protein n=1 Tax=uncultured Sphingomonas sp. TaxID=158754 RepID=UPI0025CE4B1A|nr:hypothetical protein [uncultured Sphingomonas sp.]
MTPPRTIIGTFATAPVLRKPALRRTLLLVLIVLFALLALFPQRYRAATSLTPADPSSLGLSGTLGQLGAVGNVFGNQAAVEISLKVARSEYVRSIVSKQLKLEQRLQRNSVETHRWLDRHVDIRSLRGGIVQFEVMDRDPEFARQLVGAYGDAVRQQLSIIARDQTAFKRKILIELVESASERLGRARAAYDSFRLRTRYSSPQAAIYAAGDRIPELEGIIRSKQVQLAQMRQFATDDNMRVRQVLAEIEALQAQLAAARSLSPQQQSSVGEVVRQSTQVDNLRRELDLSQNLYDNYKRFLQGTSVEDLTSSANVRVLEPAYVDSARQVNILPLSIAIVLLLLGAAIEFYTIRPPLGERSLA